ncbi:MAG TPA: substrate-binding domain-containing protein [Candidatus Bathyarchaeia archaeon]
MNRTAIIAVAIIILGAAGYGYTQWSRQQTETIAVSGAFALYPLMVQWTDEYSRLHPNIKFEVSAGGAGKGMTDALNQLVDLGMVSRQIYPEEVQRGAFWVAVATDAVVVTVNADNPVLSELISQGFIAEKLAAIYVQGNFTTWGDVVGRPEVTDPINVYTRSDACGAAATFAEYMGYAQEDLLGVGVYGDPGLAEAVRGDPFAIGYNNVNYAYDMNTGLPVEGIAVVPLDVDGDGSISQAEDYYSDRESIIDAIADGRYPSPPSRELNLVTKDEFRGATLEFIRWVLADGQEMATDAGFVPLSPERRQQEISKLGG